MRTLHVNHSYLVQLARNSAYNWMASLASIRAAVKQRATKGGCTGCHGNSKAVSIPEAAYTTAVANPRFRRDMQELRKRMEVDRVVVTVNRQRLELR